MQKNAKNPKSRLGVASAIFAKTAALVALSLQSVPANAIEASCKMVSGACSCSIGGQSVSSSNMGGNRCLIVVRKDGTVKSSSAPTKAAATPSPAAATAAPKKTGVSVSGAISLGGYVATPNGTVNAGKSVKVNQTVSGPVVGGGSTGMGAGQSTSQTNSTGAGASSSAGANANGNSGNGASSSSNASAGSGGGASASGGSGSSASAGGGSVSGSKN